MENENSDKVKTGVLGVDDMVGGGFPPGSVVVVSGTPGIGKSNFGMQYLYNGITKYGENGVYLTVEDIPDRVRDYALSFGWDFRKLEEEDKLAVIGQPLSEIKKKEVGEDVTPETLTETIKRIDAKRVVLDSITLFKYIFSTESDMRVNLAAFIREMKTMGLTTIMIAEQPESTLDVTYYDEHFLADGLIMMYWSRHKEKNERVFRVVKMRGQKINTDDRPMDITDDGIIVYPTQVPLSLSDG